MAHLHLVGVALLGMLSVTAASAQAPEAGVSRALATARAARVSDIRYSVSFSLKAHADTTAATETVTFADSGSGDLPIDYRDGTIQSASLNGKPLSTQLLNGHLMLPAAALVKGVNTLKAAFTTNVAPSGKAITRYEDKDDGSEYIYTLFVPMDASMAFPCFDQPDLKGRFSLTVEHPSDWTVIGNTAPTFDSTGRTSFPETRPISTYVFAFTAGPWAAIPATAAGQPGFYVRKSQLARAKAEAPEVQSITARGIAYLSDFFAQPFPFPKYDLVLIPGFPFGGMEHAGATFLSEDLVLFRSAPTEADYFRRDITVLHETTHQWFGDLVTMRWFDDLWLKEGFAQYMAYKALAKLAPQRDPWKHFYEDIKPLAYGIDETQGTTPIFQNIANLKDAKSAYGAIVYQKAPAVLKQLEYFLGETNFRDGLRLYLAQHAYANAQWADLVGAFARTGDKNVDAWARAWILQRGMPEVTVDWACTGGRISSFTLRQHDVLADNFLWPITLQLRLQYPAAQREMKLETKLDFATASSSPKSMIGLSCPSWVFANQGDFAYGRFPLDSVSEKAVVTELETAAEPRYQRVSASAPAQWNDGVLRPLPPPPPRGPYPKPRSGPPANAPDPLLHSMLWGALWDNVHVAQSAPRRYVELTLKTLPKESDESLNRIQGGRLATALHAYLSDNARAELAPRVEEVVSHGMLTAPTLGLRIVNFRTFTSIAQSPDALHQLKDLLAGKLSIPELTLRPLDRWNMIGHLIEMGDPEAGDSLKYEQAHDHSGEALKYAYAVQAGAPDAAVKARYFDDYLHKADLQEDWITQSLRPFNSWNQTALTAQYLAPALDELPNVKVHRKVFFLGAWLNSFIDGQASPEAQKVVQAWLAKPDVDPDLRLKVLEVSDGLDRTVRIRQKFPE